MLTVVVERDDLRLSEPAEIGDLPRWRQPISEPVSRSLITRSACIGMASKSGRSFPSIAAMR